jgi:hypothetical protein
MSTDFPPLSAGCPEVRLNMFDDGSVEYLFPDWRYVDSLPSGNVVVDWIFLILVLPAIWFEPEAAVFLVLYLARRKVHDSILVRKGWLGFRWRFWFVGWTRWCRLDHVQRLVVRLGDGISWDGDPIADELIVVGRRAKQIEVPWWGRQDALRELANELADRIAWVRGDGGRASVQVDLEDKYD